jgi:hypothetical protein
VENQHTTLYCFSNLDPEVVRNNYTRLMHGVTPSESSVVTDSGGISACLKRKPMVGAPRKGVGGHG